MPKFDEKSWKGIIVGYIHNGYKIWGVKNYRFIIARDVTVDETDFLNSRPVMKNINQIHWEFCAGYLLAKK